MKRKSYTSECEPEYIYKNLYLTPNLKELGVFCCFASFTKFYSTNLKDCLPKQGDSFGLDMKGDMKPPPAVQRGGEFILNISKSYEDMIRIQFDSFCRKILRDEFIDYMRNQKFRLEHEVSIADLIHGDVLNVGICDEYPSDYFYFNVKEYVVRVENALLAKALMSLPEEKRQIVLLSYFLDMTDQKIADDLNAVRRTIQYKRTSSLKEMKRLMEVYKDEE